MTQRKKQRARPTRPQADTFARDTRAGFSSMCRTVGHMVEHVRRLAEFAQMRASFDPDSVPLVGREARALREAVRELDAALALVEAPTVVETQGVH